MMMENNRNKIILLLLAVAVIILSVLLSVTIYSYHQITDDINARKVYLNGNLSHINSAQGNLFYRDFIAFSATKPTLNGLRSLRQELDENFAAKIFYRSESNRKISQIEQVLLRYERKMDIIDEILEVYKDDIALVEQHSSETRALVRKATGGINENTDVADYRSLLNEINQLEVRLGNAEKSINAKRGGNGHDTKAQFENKFVHALETAVKGDSESLSGLKSEIEKLTNTLQTVRANHAIIIRDFHSRTGLVNIVVNNLQPVTNNLGNWIRPVQNNIRTLEQPILPGVTGLSMIRSIDPMTYQAIILIRDTNNAILRLDNEMNDLVRNVISMQNISGRYQNQQNRSNQRDFVRQAAQTRSYLNGKITLFDPTIENLNRALGQIANYQRAVSGIRNRTVSNMLHQIGSQSSTTMNNIMAPMRDYRDNVNKMISDLGRVAEIERTYDSILNNAASFQYANRAATDVVLPKTLTIQSSGNHLTPLIVINFLGLMFLGIIVFLFIRQRDDGTGNKGLQNGIRKEAYSGKEASSPVGPSVMHGKEEIKEEVEVGDSFGEKEEFAEDTGGDGETDKTIDEDNRFSESVMDDTGIAQSVITIDQMAESAKEDDPPVEIAKGDDRIAESEKGDDPPVEIAKEDDRIAESEKEDDPPVEIAKEDDPLTEKVMDVASFAESVAKEEQSEEYSDEIDPVAGSGLKVDQLAETAEEEARLAETAEYETQAGEIDSIAGSGLKVDQPAETAEEEARLAETAEDETQAGEVAMDDDEKSQSALSLYGFNQMLPGYLLIRNGLHKGRKLALYGKSTGSGLSLTIGRDVPDWQRYVDQSKQEAHIRIVDETQTISRLQAEITYRNGKCYLRSLSNSNPTVVNDLELLENQSVLLEDGNIITAGHIQLQYCL